MYRQFFLTNGWPFTFFQHIGQNDFSPSETVALKLNNFRKYTYTLAAGINVLDCLKREVAGWPEQMATSFSILLYFFQMLPPF